VNEDNTKRIIELCPSFFRGVEGTSFCRFGFECGNGWTELLLEFANAVANTISKLPMEQGTKIVCLQIKEKFGGIRIYYSPVHPSIDNAVWVAEGKSMRTCEKCGSPGEREMNGTWMTTRCSEHRDDK